MSNNILTAITEFNLLLIFKLVILLIFLIYLVFSFLLVTQVKALNRLIYIKANQASRIIFIFAIIYLIATLSLFLIALVIL